jgi:hypothetical protein
MSIDDSWGTYTTPCPYCGGRVAYAFFGPDCRGNDGSSSIHCEGCKNSFTVEQWDRIAAPELATREHDYWQGQYQSFGAYRFSPYHPDYDFSVVKPRRRATA